MAHKGMLNIHDRSAFLYEPFDCVIARIVSDMSFTLWFDLSGAVFGEMELVQILFTQPK